MILCVGTLGSGKSALLRALQLYGIDITNAPVGGEEAVKKKVMEVPYTTPTAGTDILTISRTKK